MLHIYVCFICMYIMDTFTMKIIKLWFTWPKPGFCFYSILTHKIDSEWCLRTELFDKKDYYNLPIVNFPCIRSSIRAPPVYVVNISHLIRYARACGSYKDFLDRRLLLTAKLLIQGFLLFEMISSFRKLTLPAWLG